MRDHNTIMPNQYGEVDGKMVRATDYLRLQNLKLNEEN